MHNREQMIDRMINVYFFLFSLFFSKHLSNENNIIEYFGGSKIVFFCLTKTIEASLSFIYNAFLLNNTD